MGNATSGLPQQPYLQYGADQKFHLSVGRLCQIGRSLANEVVVQDAEVSRHHASVEARPTEYLLSDAGSRNGTYLNGKRIPGPTPLRTGDVIEVGNTKITFMWPTPAKPQLNEDATMATVLPGGASYALVLSLSGFQQVAQNAESHRLDRAINTCRDQVQQILRRDRLAPARFAGDVVILDSTNQPPDSDSDLIERLLRSAGDVAIALEQLPAHANVMGRIQVSGGLWLEEGVGAAGRLKDAINLAAQGARMGSSLHMNEYAAKEVKSRLPQAGSQIVDAPQSPFPGSASLQFFQLQQVLQ